MPTESPPFKNATDDSELAQRIFDLNYFACSISYPKISLLYHCRKSLCQLPLLPDALKDVLCKLFKAALQLDVTLCAIELHIVNDAQMMLLNKVFMRHAGPTNILSFPGDLSLTGSMILSADTAIRESRIYGQDCEDYIFHLLTHGMAHLSGFEHGPEMEIFEDCLKSFAWK